MYVTDSPPPAPSSAPWRALRRAALVGAAVALVVAGAGLAAEHVVFGRDDAAARQRLEGLVAARFDGMARGLRDMAATLADPVSVRSAAAGDTSAARLLFTTAGDQVSTQQDHDVAVTVYGPDAVPVAWAGRPSALPLDRLQGPEAWFFTHDALGPRLVFVMPVFGDGARVGTIAAERAPLSREALPISAATGLQSRAAVRLPTWLAEVSIEPPPAAPGGPADPLAFDIRAPSGDRLLTATVAPESLADARARWRAAIRSGSVGVVAVTILLLAGPLLDWRRRARNPRHYATAVALTASAVVGGRLVLRAAAPEQWTTASIVSVNAGASTFLERLVASPLDFLLTALAAGALVALAIGAVLASRPLLRSHRRTASGARRVAAFALVQVAGGAAAAVVLLAYEALLRDTIARTTLDLLRVTLHSVTLAPLALQVALIVAHAAALGLLVLPLLVAFQGWIVPRGALRLRLLAIACWAGPAVAWRAGAPPAALVPVAAALIGAAALTLLAPRLWTWFRHGSQAFRLTLVVLGLVVPAFTFYPTVLELSWQAKIRLVESRYAPQALDQRQDVHTRLRESLDDLDRVPDLSALLTTTGSDPLTDRAYLAWQTTSLARNLITSSVELYGPDGLLTSRFAFNLPEDLSAAREHEEPECRWELYEEVAPFFAEDRRVLHAGRRICRDGAAGPALGSIVVHAMLDYEDLPFIATRNPYIELLRPADPLRDQGLAGRDVEYANYGWSGTPLYWSGDTAWPLPDGVFPRIVASRTPFWAQLRRGTGRYDVYLLNDRGSIHAIGFPAVTTLDHLVNLAELVVLAAGTFLLVSGAGALHGWASRRRPTAPALLRELRASFYRKLFLAFVLAVFLPVTLLAVVTRNYVADQMRANVEQEAIRTASVARRVVEDLVATRSAQNVRIDDDNLMVWVSRLIGQDVNTFTGPRLIATSERNLFASGLLPTRTPADLYHALELRNEATTVTREQIGRFEYLVAGTALDEGLDAVLTVPLTSRQQEIESQIDALDRRVLLGALLFILAGAGLGYTMAERIADPVNRLTRATRRIARGELDVRIAATSSDELRRLVEDFNSMAGELQRQRGELERTNRLEAWAEMARQVAHDIKNPLTPIQLNAEHLRRVHADRGGPLGPVLQDCVETILTQVRLLRQIAAEFSSFASSPTARPATVDVAELLREVVEPYRAGLEARIRFDVDIPPGLPPVRVDRTLVGRALTNLIENALHAMPGTGTLAVAAHAEGGGGVRVRIADTGVGMDAQALARAFDPSFSTKATGTGLGLPIAKRNVELSGGTIGIASERDRGTRVDVVLPIDTTVAV